MGSFSESVSSWGKRTIQEIDAGVNEAIKDFCFEVIENTPYDVMETQDGMVAMDNWSLETPGEEGQTVFGQNLPSGISKTKVTNKLASFRASKDGALVFMNNAHSRSKYIDGVDRYYADLLEFGLYPWDSSRRVTNGYSKQAVGGFVRYRLVEFHFSLRNYFGSSIKGFSREF